MTVIVKIDRVTGEVIPGEPQTGDYVRITTSSGAVIKQEYAAPPAPPPPRPIVFRTGKDMALQLITWLGGNAAARAALGAIVRACQGSANGADNFFAYYLTLENFTKDEFLAVLNAVSVSIITQPQKDYVANNWPEV